MVGILLSLGLATAGFVIFWVAQAFHTRAVLCYEAGLVSDFKRHEATSQRLDGLSWGLVLLGLVVLVVTLWLGVAQ